MHTLAKNAHHNERLILDFIQEAYPNTVPDLEMLVRDNIVNGTQLLELAVSKSGGIPLCPVGHHRDLIDDSDVKTVTIQKVVSWKKRVLKTGVKKKYKSTVYTASIDSVDKKIGVLRIICWNNFAEKYMYFKIPPSAIYGLKILKISFDSETFQPTGKYSKYQVETFKEMAAPLTLREQVSTIICNLNRDNIENQLDNIIELINK
jgi:hypothetical protein